MEKSFFYHLFCVTQETYLSKDFWEIYMSHFSYVYKTEGENGISHLISETA